MFDKKNNEFYQLSIDIVIFIYRTIAILFRILCNCFLLLHPR